MCIQMCLPDQDWPLSLLSLAEDVSRQYAYNFGGILFSIMSCPILFSQKVPGRGASQITWEILKLFYFPVSKPFPCATAVCRCPSLEGAYQRFQGLTEWH